MAFITVVRHVFFSSSESTQLHWDSGVSWSLTHESDEFVLQLVVQTSDHHFHRVSDFPHSLILCSPDSLYVPLLKHTYACDCISQISGLNI